MTNKKLFYTIETILSELGEIIRDNDNLPNKIIQCYEELEELSSDIDILMYKTGLTSDKLISEIYDVYQDMLDIYFEYLEIK